MEPGHEDREYEQGNVTIDLDGDTPQWSPVMKTGNTRTVCHILGVHTEGPQWSPVMKTGNTAECRTCPTRRTGASMEPGHEDREYPRHGRAHPLLTRASMEPGHEDREYVHDLVPQAVTQHASMEPGHEDREYACSDQTAPARDGGPQWSPVMKTGNTWSWVAAAMDTLAPQWSPVMKTGNTDSFSFMPSFPSMCLNGARS